MLDNFEIYLVSDIGHAKELDPDVTVEAEYGDYCVEGKELTLAHHGSRSDNPAPCNTEVEPLERGTIVVSHIDLDTVGGVLAVTGDKLEDRDFWQGAEHLDVYGPHRIGDLDRNVQDQLNAVDGWVAKREHEISKDAVCDVKDDIRAYKDFLEKVIDREHPEHEQVLEEGREWVREMEAERNRVIESKLVFENEMVRAFRTDGVFCAASYHSERQDIDVPATVTFNERFNSITVAFRDGGKEQGGDLSAREIVQELWGKEAGGRDGIAGSPRGVEMTEKDFVNTRELVMDKLIEHEREVEKDIDIASDRDEPSR